MCSNGDMICIEEPLNTNPLSLFYIIVIQVFKTRMKIKYEKTCLFFPIDNSVCITNLQISFGVLLCHLMQLSGITCQSFFFISSQGFYVKECIHTIVIYGLNIFFNGALYCHKSIISSFGVQKGHVYILFFNKGI